ncbi:MAG: metal ABC transporter permease [Candidatus Hecatellaceae archaeon]
MRLGVSFTVWAACLLAAIFTYKLSPVFSYGFMRGALAVGVLAGVLSGLISTYIVAKRVTLMSGGISHAAFGGIGLGYLLGVNPLLATIPFSLAATLTALTVGRKARVHEDAVLAVLWTGGMGLGVLFIALSGRGFSHDLIGYLFGSLFAVSPVDFWLIVGVSICVLAAIALFHKDFVIICFDEEYGRALGLPVDGLNLLLMCLAALTVIALIRAVGILLSIALLVVPAVIALRLGRSLPQVMVSSVLLAVSFIIYGAWFSYMFDLPSGAAVLPASAILFALALLEKSLVKPS